MKFFKKNSYEIVRLFVIQIGITIFSLVVTTAAQTAFDGERALLAKLVVSLFSIAFYLFIIYSTAWEFGSKHQKEDADKYYGLKCITVASLPNIFLGILMCIGLLRLAYPESIFAGLYAIPHLIAGLLESMHLGFLQYVKPTGENAQFVFSAIYYLLSSVPAILVTHVAYTLGRKNIRLTKGTPPSRE